MQFEKNENKNLNNNILLAKQKEQKKREEEERKRNAELSDPIQNPDYPEYTESEFTEETGENTEKGEKLSLNEDFANITARINETYLKYDDEHSAQTLLNVERTIKPEKPKRPDTEFRDYSNSVTNCRLHRSIGLKQSRKFKTTMNNFMGSKQSLIPYACRLYGQPSSYISRIRFCTEDILVAVASTSGQCHIYNWDLNLYDWFLAKEATRETKSVVTVGEPLEKFLHEKRIDALAWDPVKHNTIAIGGLNSTTIKLIDLAKNRRHTLKQQTTLHKSGIMELEYSKENQLIAGTKNGDLFHWDLRKRNWLEPIISRNAKSPIKLIIPEQNYQIKTVKQSGNLQCWDFRNTRQCLKDIQIIKDGRIEDVKYDKKSNSLAIYSEEANVVQLFNLDNEKEEKLIPSNQKTRCLKNQIIIHHIKFEENTFVFIIQ
eukprot:UN32820